MSTGGDASGNVFDVGTPVVKLNRTDRGLNVSVRNSNVSNNPGDLQFKYLQVGDLRRLEQMLFAPRRTIEGRFSGHYATRQRGQSVEFRDYRPYFPGDEVSAIDWKVYGRTDRLVIKLFEQQSELTVHLLVDASGSMDFRGATLSAKADTKFDYACRLAAAIGFLISKQHDRFSFAMCQRQVGSDKSPLRYFFPPDRNVRHLMGVLEGMETARPKGESALAESLHELARRGKRRELVVVFSDLLGEPDEVAEALASRVQFGGEAVVMHILHPDEIQLPDVDRGIFIDAETGGKVRVDVPEIRDAYHKKMQEFLEGWEARCTAMGIDYCRMDTTEPYWESLERYLIGRASVGR